MSILAYLLAGSNNPSAGELDFHSSDHIRYQNGIDVSGHNYGCNRTIKIEKNISGDEGYTVTIFNDDSVHPFWGTNIQMAPKQMKIVNKKTNLVELRGFGHDPMGNSFSNYGITIEFSGQIIKNITLHMFDRGVDLKYFD